MSSAKGACSALRVSVDDACRSSDRAQASVCWVTTASVRRSATSIDEASSGSENPTWLSALDASCTNVSGSVMGTEGVNVWSGAANRFLKGRIIIWRGS